MGRRSPQPKLFYCISLEERVPEDHLLRKISEIIDFSFIYDYVRSYYSHTGSPSVDPVVIFKMALLGYLYGITSERKLAEECRLNLAFMWFLGYDFDEMPPDHSILSKARARFGREAYEQFFRHIVQVCQERGLIQGEKVFIDASVIQANASLDSLVKGEIYQEEEQRIKEYLDEVWRENKPGEEDNGSDSGGAGATNSDRQVRKRARKSEKRWTSRTDAIVNIKVNHSAHQN